MRIIPLFCLLFLFGCKNDSETDQIMSKEETFKTSTSLVSVYKTSQAIFKHYHKIQGSVISKKMAYIRPEINGSVNFVHVKEGDFVKKKSKISYPFN
jgi:multidrug efflux pump subunit AcrA (membrane-fusion protein)